MNFLIVASLIIVALASLWLLLFRRSRFTWSEPAPRPREERAEGMLETVFFPALDGTRIEGWLVTPRAAQPPLVIMAPGLTGTKEGFLENFAWRFAAQGIAALMIDYRCFGGSQGMPRHWVDPERHRQDYEAALRFARGELASRGVIDAQRVALWGSSFSGGTALVTAARDANVVAVIAQGPYLEAAPAIVPKGLHLLRFIVCAMLDMLPWLPPVYIPAFGRPGEWAFAPSRENPSVRDFSGHLGHAFWRELPSPQRGGWENRMLARMLPTFDEFQPLAHAVEQVRCPILFVAGKDDDLVPHSVVERAFALARSPRKQLRIFECGHFDLYVSDISAENAELQARFLGEELSRPTAQPQSA